MREPHFSFFVCHSSLYLSGAEPPSYCHAPSGLLISMLSLSLSLFQFFIFHFSFFILHSSLFTFHFSLPGLSPLVVPGLSPRVNGQRPFRPYAFLLFTFFRLVSVVEPSYFGFTQYISFHASHQPGPHPFSYFDFAQYNAFHFSFFVFHFKNTSLRYCPLL